MELEITPPDKRFATEKKKKTPILTRKVYAIWGDDIAPPQKKQ